jgi:hypothetical protein
LASLASRGKLVLLKEMAPHLGNFVKHEPGQIAVALVFNPDKAHGPP